MEPTISAAASPAPTTASAIATAVAPGVCDHIIVAVVRLMAAITIADITPVAAAKSPSDAMTMPMTEITVIGGGRVGPRLEYGKANGGTAGGAKFGSSKFPIDPCADARRPFHDVVYDTTSGFIAVIAAILPRSICRIRSAAFAASYPNFS